MLKIAVTPPDILDDEPRCITMILDHGWDFVHLRHPDASLREVKNVIESMPPRLHVRLRLHGHFELLNEFNLGGIHLNSRCPVPPPRYTGSVSRTCHTVNEVAEEAHKYDYVTLSPIFDSISKQGYTGAFSDEELMSLPKDKVVALGGISPDRFKELSAYPFAGFAMLGYLFGMTDADTLRSRLNAVDSALRLYYK